MLEFRANKGVVLASGGFSANVELRMQYNDKLDEKISTTNSPGATGDGIIMARDVGAALVGMEYIQLLPLGTPGDGALHNWVEAGADEMIFVSKYGKRFVREDARRDDLTNALFEQPDSLMYVVVDSSATPWPRAKTTGVKRLMSCRARLCLPGRHHRRVGEADWRPCRRSSRNGQQLQLLLRYRRRQRVRQGANEGPD